VPSLPDTGGASQTPGASLHVAVEVIEADRQAQKTLSIKN
jgi:hypothetical protein